MTNTSDRTKTGSKEKTNEIRAAENQTMALEVLQKSVADAVLVKISHFQQAGDIKLPPDYSAENALKSAWLVLLETKDAAKRPVLEVCTKESIANALLNMVIQGLNPVKKQCAFIAYDDKLTMQREYHGTIALAKRFGGVKVVTANVIYEGDEFTYSINPVNGFKVIESHVQSLQNIDNNKILGAYATLVLESGESYTEIMTMVQIRTAWNQGATHGASPAHKNFPEEMAKKTVIGRACKLFITSSDDGALFDDQVIGQRDQAALAADLRIKTDANTEVLDIKEDIPAAQVVKDGPPDGAGSGELFESNAGKPSF